MQFYEDLVVGEVHRFGAYAVTRDEVIAFASKYDPQPFHLDDAAAAAHPFFGRLAISGWQTCAYAMRLMVADMKARNVQSLGSPGMDGIRWVKPVYPGDQLTLESETLEVRPSRSRPEMGAAKRRYTMRNQNGDVVMTMEATGLFATRPKG